MEKPEQIPTDLAIGLGQDLTADEFVGVVRNFFGYIAEIAKAQGEAAAGIRWTVRVREGSTVIGAEPSADAPAAALKKIYAEAGRGLRLVKSGENRKMSQLRGTSLPEKAVDNLERLSAFANKHPDGGGMRIWIQRKPMVVGPEVVEKIRDYKGKDYRDGGSIEGRLVGIHEGPGPLHIKVKDVLVARPIKCFIPEAMLKDALKYFRRRVEVEGLIHYRHDGEPVSIQAEEMRVMPEDHELPPIESFIGILADR